MGRPLATLFAVLLLIGACGDDDAPLSANGSSDDPQGEETVYRGTATILESPDHGPQLCGNVQESLPPQCGGPDIIGWDWDEVDGEESAGGTTWGDYQVTGTWDDETQTLTLTEPPGPPGEWNSADTDFTSPCPEPPGGWTPPDPSTTSEATLEQAQEVARSLPGFAGSWVDQSPNPAMAEDADPAAIESAANDPMLLVLNVLVTEDVAGAEAAIRDVWGGALCVSEADHSLDELRAIQDEIIDELGPIVTGAGQNTVTNRVSLFTYVATEALRDDVEQRYGDAVEISALLEPVEP